MDDYDFTDFTLAAKNRGFVEVTDQWNSVSFKNIRKRGFQPDIDKRYFENKRKRAHVTFDRGRIFITRLGTTLWQGRFNQIWDAANHLP